MSAATLVECGPAIPGRGLRSLRHSISVQTSSPQRMMVARFSVAFTLVTIINLRRPGLRDIEGDWSWTKANGSSTQPWTVFPSGAVISPSATSLSSTLDWVSSLRGRLGFLVTPSLLAYATGGGAWARIGYSARAMCTAVGCAGGGYFANAAVSSTETGYTVGGGLEWAMTGNWLVRAEYLYYRFNNGPNITASAGPVNNPSGFAWSGTSVSVARAGLSYKF